MPFMMIVAEKSGSGFVYQYEFHEFRQGLMCPANRKPPNLQDREVFAFRRHSDYITVHTDKLGDAAAQYEQMPRFRARVGFFIVYKPVNTDAVQHTACRQLKPVLPAGVRLSGISLPQDHPTHDDINRNRQQSFFAFPSDGEFLCDSCSRQQ